MLERLKKAWAAMKDVAPAEAANCEGLIRMVLKLEEEWKKSTALKNRGRTSEQLKQAMANTQAAVEVFIEAVRVRAPDVWADYKAASVALDKMPLMQDIKLMRAALQAENEEQN